MEAGSGGDIHLLDDVEDEEDIKQAVSTPQADGEGSIKLAFL